MMKAGKLVAIIFSSTPDSERNLLMMPFRQVVIVIYQDAFLQTLLRDRRDTLHVTEGRR